MTDFSGFCHVGSGHFGARVLGVGAASSEA